MKPKLFLLATIMGLLLTNCLLKKPTGDGAGNINYCPPDRECLLMDDYTKFFSEINESIPGGTGDRILPEEIGFTRPINGYKDFSQYIALMPNKVSDPIISQVSVAYVYNRKGSLVATIDPLYLGWNEGSTGILNLKKEPLKSLAFNQTYTVKIMSSYGAIGGGGNDNRMMYTIFQMKLMPENQKP